MEHDTKRTSIGIVGALLATIALVVTMRAQTALWPFPSFSSEHSYLIVDVNGDGITDMIVSSAFAGHGAIPNTGYYAVVSGFDGQLIYERFGTAANSFLRVPGSIGDVTGDGRGDFVAHVANQPMSIISGATGLPVASLLVSDSETALGLGDVNGDGFGDFALGCCGAVSVFAGPNGVYLYSVYGQHSFGFFGSVLERGGDFNFDGVHDFLVSEPGNENIATICPTRVYVCSGTDGSFLRIFSAGVCSNYGYGLAIACPGDLDGDGIPEVVVGWPLASMVTVYSGATGALLFQHLGTSGPPGSPVGIGLRVCAIGDADRDGIPDYGFKTEWAEFEIRSGANHGLLVRSGLNPPSPPFPQGSFTIIGSLGDINNDGWPEVVAVEPGYGYFAYALIPQGAQPFGSANAQPNGSLPLIGISGVPRVGQNFSVNLSKVPAGRDALLAIGLSDLCFGGNPLPWDLTSLGFPGAVLRVSVDGSIAATTQSLGANGANARVAFTFPTLPSLAGMNFFAQWAIANNPALPAPLSLTEALRVQIQP